MGQINDCKFSVMGGGGTPPVDCSSTLTLGEDATRIGFLIGTFGAVDPAANVHGDPIYEFTVDNTGRAVLSYGLLGNDFPIEGTFAALVTVDGLELSLYWEADEDSYIGDSLELYTHLAGKVGDDVCVNLVDTTDVKFLAASYSRTSYELKQEAAGAGGETCTHTAEIYPPDYLGVYHAFGANEPVWEGARVASVVGPEMVPNGDFETNVDGFVAVDPVQLSIQHNIDRADVVGTLATESTTWALISPSLNIDIGKTYKAYAEFTQEAGQTAGRVYVGTANNGGQYLNETTLVGALKVVDIEFIATTTTVTISFRCRLTLDQVSFADRLSIKEVLSVCYADDGTGTLLDPLPMLVYQKATTNHFLNSAAPVTQDVTVVSGQEYTVWVLGAGSITLSGAGTGVATEGSKFTFTASTTTLTCTYAATLTHVQVEDGVVQNGLITTAGTAVSTDEIINTWAAANHADAGQNYEADYKLSGEDQVLLSMGGTAVLSVVSGDVVLSDGTNSCSTPVVSAEPHIKATYNRVLGAELIANGDFSNGTTGWAAYATGSTIDAIGEQLNCETTFDTKGFYQQMFGLIGGTEYVVRFDVTELTVATNVGVGLGSGIGNITSGYFTFTNTGHHEYTFIALGDGDLYLSFQLNTVGTISVDNVSFKEKSVAESNMQLDVDGVKSAEVHYNGTLGSGDLSTKATQRDLIRRES